MSYETILTSVDDGILTITLNRPERLNAWTPQMGGELREAITEGNDDESVTAMVVTGAGRGFCAGADIEEVFKAQADGNAPSRGSNSPGDWVGLIRSSKPMVGAINGPAIGVGLTQVLPMDYLVASKPAKLSLRFVKMGLVPELASSHFVNLRVGFGNTSELMLTGKTILAEEALEIGLVDRVTEPDGLLPAAHEIAKSMGENPQEALRMIKSLITRNTSESDLAAVQQRELEALKQCYVSPEHTEAIAAFLEKREPDFKAARSGS